MAKRDFDIREKETKMKISKLQYINYFDCRVEYIWQMNL